jgi:AraC-like DNA-binding protein
MARTENGKAYPFTVFKGMNSDGMITKSSCIGVQKSIRSALTLGVAINVFMRDLARERATSIYSVKIAGYNIRLCRRRYHTASAATNIYTDLEFFSDLKNIISYYVGRDWFPQYIGANIHEPFETLKCLLFPNTKFIHSQNNSWLEIPRRYLTLPRQSHDILDEQTLSPHHPQNIASQDWATLICALKHLLIEHSSSGYPAIGCAARLMHTSVRTLQRHLAQANLTYTKLVEYTQFEVAADMLADPNTKIIDIAYTLGYEDPSHFSRAFRRIAGQSPREFRLSRLTKLKT